ncbi:MAG: hypothetical protein WB930_10160 [Syntrophobacteraceae bacterium]
METGIEAADEREVDWIMPVKWILALSKAFEKCAKFNISPLRLCPYEKAVEIGVSGLRNRIADIPGRDRCKILSRSSRPIHPA